MERNYKRRQNTVRDRTEREMERKRKRMFFLHIYFSFQYSSVMNDSSLKFVFFFSLHFRHLACVECTMLRCSVLPDTSNFLNYIYQSAFSFSSISLEVDYTYLCPTCSEDLVLRLNNSRSSCGFHCCLFVFLNKTDLKTVYLFPNSRHIDKARCVREGKKHV